MDPDEQAVAYGEFLALARDEGLIAVEVMVVQAPNETNGRCAVVQAIARTAQGAFAAVGEATPQSAPPPWQPFLTTLAELRAKARALRELTGLEHTVSEELAVPYAPTGDEVMEPPARAPRPAPVPPVAARPAERPPAAVAAAPSPRPAPVRPAGGAPTPRGAVDDANAGADEAPEAPAEPDDDATAAPPTPFPRAAAVPETPAAEETAPDFEGIDRDMEDKLLKLARTIASLEGSDISEAEARQKLDDFFTRAFKHPFNRATRMEGQRVVQRLSSDLVRLRAASNDDKE